MSRAPNIELQKSIIRTAYLLYSEKGYDKITTRQLADSCGISRSLLYHYFNTKAALCSEIFLKIRAMVTEYLNQCLDFHYPDPSFGAYRNGLIMKICLRKNIITALSNVKESPELLQAMLGITSLNCDEVRERKLNRVELGRMLLYAILQQLLVCKEEGLLDISYWQAFQNAQASYYILMGYDQIGAERILSAANTFLTDALVKDCITFYEHSLGWES